MTRWLLCFLVFLNAAPACAQAGGSDLKLLISISQTTVTAPLAAQVVLHFHNSGQQTLLLATPVRDASVVSGAINPFMAQEPGPDSTTGGSALHIHLVPLSGGARDSSGEGRVLEIAGFPHPKLVALAPGDDYQEKTFVRLSPATRDADKPEPLWGSYKFSVTFSASYSNGDNLNRILDTDIWQGRTESNIVEVNLQPPAPDSHGSISGSVLGSNMLPTFGAVVTLSDQQEQVIAQASPDENGKFSFVHLPFGFYWVTARRLDSTQDSSVFRHVELSGGDPVQTVQLVILRPEINHARQLLHKPVVIRIFDSKDQPVGDVSLESTWSSGTVLDNVKGRTASDGVALLELLPGRNYLSLQRKECPKQDERIDVEPGGGIDGFKLVLTCAKR
jgi:hypothetical protein